VIAKPRGTEKPATVHLPKRLDDGDIGVLGVKTPRWGAPQVNTGPSSGLHDSMHVPVGEVASVPRFDRATEHTSLPFTATQDAELELGC